MRKLVLILLALIAVVTFISTYSGLVTGQSDGIVKASMEAASRQ